MDKHLLTLTFLFVDRREEVQPGLTEIWFIAEVNLH